MDSFVTWPLPTCWFVNSSPSGDTKEPDPPDPTTETDRRVDFPKMLRGGLKAAAFTAYTPQGRRDAEGLAVAAARAEDMLRHIRTRADGSTRRFCTTASELEAAHAVVRNSFRADLIRLKSELVDHGTNLS